MHCSRRPRSPAHGSSTISSAPVERCGAVRRTLRHVSPRIDATTADAVLEHIGAGADLIVPLANGEPVTVLDAVEAAADELARRPRPPDALPCTTGRICMARSATGCATSPTSCRRSLGRAFAPGRSTSSPTTSARCARSSTRAPPTRSSSPRRHHLTATATSASVSTPTTSPPSSAGPASSSRPTQRMPRTFGRNQVHISQVVGWCEADYPLVEVSPPPSEKLDDRIAASSPSGSRTAPRSRPASGPSRTRSSSALARPPRPRRAHRAALRRSDRTSSTWAWSPASRKQLNRTKAVGTFALGTRRLYDFLDENTAFELWPVRYVNDPRVIAQEPGFVSINATISVDLLGQCASETIARQLLLLERGPGRLRPRGDVLRRRAGLRRPALDDQGRVDLQDRVPARRRATSSRRSRTPSTRSSPSGASPSSAVARSGSGTRADRHRTSRPSRPLASGSGDVGLLLKS